MRLIVHHETVYDYPEPVMNSVNEAWLRPLTDERQSCLNFRLNTSPASDPRPYTDYFGNTVYHFDVHEPHSRLRVTADAEVLTEPFDVSAALNMDTSPLESLSVEAGERWLDFLAQTPLTYAGAEVILFARDVAAGQTTVSAFLRSLLAAVHQRVDYHPGATHVGTCAEDALALGSGVCQDHAHVLLAVCRVAGVPARYISGYLHDDGGAPEAQASHAWAEALLPATGWVGLDPANNCFADERYVRVAIGRDYSDVPPVRGAYAGSSGAGPGVSVSVQNVQQ
jgi:transglutaminase-like putative cysteine protease